MHEEIPANTTATAEPTGEPAPPSNDSTASEEQVYDQAIASLLDDDEHSPNPPEQQPGGEASEQQDGGEASPDGGETPLELTQEQQQLLARQHLSPEMLRHWTPEQRQQFLENAAKRESDQTRSYQQLKAELDQLKEQLGQQQEGGDDEGGETGEEGEGGNPAGSLSEQARQLTDEMVDAYGDDIRPLAEMTGRLAQQLEQSQQAGEAKDRLLVDLSTDHALRDLASEFPSLDSSDARKQVLNRFAQDWKANPPEGANLLERIRNGIRSAAEAEFQHENAAQVAQQQNRQRLRQQPTAGRGTRGRGAPQSEDDIYEQGFAETIGKELRG